MNNKREPKWVLEKTVIHIHLEQIAKYGGLAGIRDRGLLQSALEHPKHLFHYEAPDLFDLAATYLTRLVKNHPFNDGNKRVAYITSRLFLLNNGYDIKTSKEKRLEMIIKITEGSITEDTLSAWFRSHHKKIV